MVVNNYKHAFTFWHHPGDRTPDLLIPGPVNFQDCPEWYYCITNLAEPHSDCLLSKCLLTYLCTHIYCCSNENLCLQRLSCQFKFWRRRKSAGRWCRQVAASLRLLLELALVLASTSCLHSSPEWYKMHLKQLGTRFHSCHFIASVVTFIVHLSFVFTLAWKLAFSQIIHCFQKICSPFLFRCSFYNC